MKNKKYIIRIYDETYHSRHPYYFQRLDPSANSYYGRWEISEATEFVREELKETVKGIKSMYEEELGNGILDHIEVLDAKTLQVIDIYKDEDEDEDPTSRFELMEL